MLNLDFSTKQLVDTYSYSTVKSNRETAKKYSFNGRWYMKFGMAQVVTFVGLVYECDKENAIGTEKVLVVGLSKQNPNDLRVDKQVAIETATENAMCNPFMVMKITDSFNKHDFHDMMELYVAKMNLQLVKTSCEIKHEKELRKAE